MRELPPAGLDVAIEVGWIASAPASNEERAEALLESLRRVVPFQAARIALLDPKRREPVSLVVEGYDDRARTYFDSPAVVEELELLGLFRERRPVLIRDLPVPPAEVRGWVEFLEPVGFREGLAVGLFTPDGRFVGLLGMNTDSAAHPTDAARDLIGLLAPGIAHAVDPLNPITAAARLVQDATAGIVLTRAGDALPLPGLPAHPLLTAGSTVLTVATGLLAGGAVHAGFLCPYARWDTSDDHGYFRLTVLALPSQAPQYLEAVVVVSPPGDISALTPRELQILGLLVEGWPNPRIAGALVITEHTVATHVEHILTKLAVPTRTAAAVRALRQGLYVPRLLTGVQGRA